MEIHWLRVGNSALSKSGYGLGYSIPSGSVRILFTDNSVDPSAYTSGTDKWTRVSQTPNVWEYTDSGVFMYGELHWGLGLADFWWNRERVEWYLLKARVDIECTLQDCVGGRLLGITGECDFSGVKNADYLFSGQTYLDTISGTLDFSSATRAVRMFSGTKINEPPKLVMPSLQTAREMFANCTYMTSVPSSLTFDFPSLLDASGLFVGCTGLVSAEAHFNFPLCTNAADMYEGCRVLEYIPENIYMPNCISIRGMFHNCFELKSISETFRPASVENCSNAFEDCFKVGSGALSLYQFLSSKPVAVEPTSHRDVFWRCGRDSTTGHAELEQIPGSWGGLAPN